MNPMKQVAQPNRRALLAAGAAGLASLAAGPAHSEEATDDNETGRVCRIGVLSASIGGVPQKTNGHTWHFAHGFHPTVNMDVVAKYLDPGSVQQFKENFRNPSRSFDLVPFADTRITHYYDADPASAAMFAEAFPGVQVAASAEALAAEVDAVWMGDASGRGEDHFDLVAPGLARGVPTFCDKPIGGTVAGTRKILEFARQHNAPIMSSSLFRHQWGTEEALRMRDGGEHGPIEYIIASQAGGWSLPGWMVYGQHPVWMVMTLAGPGVDAVSMYARENACHALITYADRMPAEVWYGRPDASGTYCHTAIHFQKRAYDWTPAIEGNYWFGHHYQITRMAETFRRMIRTREEPIPHQEILEVTAIIHAGVKSLNEGSRLVPLAEVMET
jgi:predicted dehydrogenase